MLRLAVAAALLQGCRGFSASPQPRRALTLSEKRTTSTPSAAAVEEEDEAEDEAGDEGEEEDEELGLPEVTFASRSEPEGPPLGLEPFPGWRQARRPGPSTASSL